MHCFWTKNTENSLLPPILGNRRQFQALTLQTEAAELTFCNELFGDIIWQCPRDSHLQKIFLLFKFEEIKWRLRTKFKYQARSLLALSGAQYFVLLWGVQNLPWFWNMLSESWFSDKAIWFAEVCVSAPDRCLESNGTDTIPNGQKAIFSLACLHGHKERCPVW